MWISPNAFAAHRLRTLGPYGHLFFAGWGGIEPPSTDWCLYRFRTHYYSIIISTCKFYSVCILKFSPSRTDLLRYHPVI